jgi:hypothetical protein
MPSALSKLKKGQSKNCGPGSILSMTYSSSRLFIPLKKHSLESLLWILLNFPVRIGC